jgi:putative transposase
VSVQVRRAAVSYATGRGLSQRRACTLLSVGRSALSYVPRKAATDAPAVARMSELARVYPRYGYRRIQVFLGRDGHAMSAGRAYRLWRAAGLQVPRKRPRRRVASGRPRPQAPTGANQVWSYDFVFDRCANGQQLKCLTVTDEWTREGLAIEVDGRIRSGRVIEVLARLVSERGAPLHLRSDNGPEFVSRALLAWITAQGIDTALIDPGKPWQNGAGESFNGKFRDECLSLEWFRSRAEAKAVIESWRRHYNEVRPHSSLGYLTPAAFARLEAKTAAFQGATGRSAAVCGASTPRPVARPPHAGQQAERRAAVSS